MLAHRLASSFSALFVAYAAVYLAPNWVFLLVVMSFIIIGLMELFAIISSNGIFVYRYFGVIIGALIPVSIYLHLGQNYTDMEPLLIVLACMFTFILQFIRKEKAKDHIISIAVTLLGLFYVSWFFSFLVKLKFLPDGNNLVIFLILVTKVGDVGAYFTGRKFGKHKLIPRISPNKTVEGTYGGLFCSLLMSMALCRGAGFTLNQGIVLGVFLGVLGQVGDLAESLIKRDCNVKDAGSKVPGFGGMLDLIDSLLFTAPIFYFYVSLIR